MSLSLGQSHTKKLVLALGSFDINAHLLRPGAQVLALVLQVLDLLIVLVLDLHQVFEFYLVPLELLLESDNPGILRQFCVLLLRFVLEHLQLILDFIHVRLERKPKIVSVLPQHGFQLSVVGFKRACDVVEIITHLAHDPLKFGDERVVAGAPASELVAHVRDERFKN